MLRGTYHDGCTYHVADGLGKYVDDLWLAIGRLSPVKEGVEALLEDNEREVEDGSDLVPACAIEAVTNRLVYSGRVMALGYSAVAAGETGNDGTFVEDPHPQLVDHDEA